MEPKNIIYYQSVFEKHQKNCRQLYMAGLVFCFLVFCQITLGGWVSSNYSALACPDFPTCQNQWLPDMDVASGFNIFQEIGPNYLGGVLDNPSRVAIHFTHRLGALIILISFILLYFLFVRIRSGDALLEPIKNRVKLIGIILLIQISLGLANIKFLIPLPVAIFHNLCGLLLLSVSLIFVWKVLEIRSRSKQFYYQDSAELNHQAALHESGVAL